MSYQSLEFIPTKIVKMIIEEVATFKSLANVPL